MFRGITICHYEVTSISPNPSNLPTQTPKAKEVHWMRLHAASLAFGGAESASSKLVESYPRLFFEMAIWPSLKDIR